ncbi:MAG: Phage protein [uncultured Acetobacteraceae bacterium]|uniref:Phage protein n=1 Tax=uncultured Acetobacteraceae bacterium TaxID=169975 RepID=A0A6J4JPE3_9PROT|nr:MAG: Phage protein [uncultured Acetobacteraceae bacterium]
MLDEGRYASISEMAAGERVERGYLGSLVRLTLLAPDIVEAIMDGRWLADRGLPRLMEPFPLDWGRQRATLRAQLGSAGLGKLRAPRPRRNEPLSVRVAAAERSDAAISVDR